MKIHFDGVNWSSKSGPNTFAWRLATSLYRIGHDVVEEGNTGADVSLVFIEASGKPLAKKVVQRLDGIWFKPNEFHVKNTKIQDLYSKADCVVWQSEFDKTFTSKWFGPPHLHGKVIGNGIELNPVKNITIPELAKIRSSYDKVFVCSSNWHAQKRLKSNIMLFDHLRRTQFPNSCLFVMGANPDVSTSDPNIFFTGSQPHEVYLQVFAVSNWMLHLAWADHCPNVVVESLSQGTPVICSDVGGTKEIVGEFGIILKDQPYNFELADYDNPPIIDYEKIGPLPNKETLGEHANIDIDKVATSYIELFKSLI